MKVAGIIAEYNPFHLGHAYHIEETKRLTGADFVVAVMSGDFVQRGGPAFLSKYQRTRMALLGGADLVFELPSTHACESAELFARSGVELLAGLGCIDTLSFGSETGDAAPFISLGRYLADEPEAFQSQLRMQLKNGLSFPAARQKALETIFPSTDWGALLSTPNNILGIEYCKALARSGSAITPVSIKRKGSDYHTGTLDQPLPSATAIRNSWISLNSSDKRDMSELSSCFPQEVYSMLQKEVPLDHFLTEQDFSLPLRWLLYSSDAGQLASYLDLTPDLAQRLINTRDSYEDFSQYVTLLKTKELTYSRICRALFHALLGIRSLPALSYARLLGFRRSAAPVLSAIKKQGSLPLITKLADAPFSLSPSSMTLLEDNTRIAHLYKTVLCEKTRLSFLHEYQQQMIILP